MLEVADMREGPSVGDLVDKIRLEHARARRAADLARDLVPQALDTQARVRSTIVELGEQRQIARATLARARDARQRPPPPATVTDIATAWRDGTRDEIRDNVLHQYAHVAEQLARRYSGRGEPYDDLNQVALLALMKAADRFDPDRGVKFETYASKVVAGELKRHFRDRTWSLRVPRALQELHLRLRTAAEELRHDLGRSPTVPELASYLAVSDEDVLEAIEVGDAYRLASLDAPVRGTDGEQLQVGGADHGYEATDHRDAVERLLARLGAEDRMVTRLYYLHGMSQAEIGRRLGVSQVHVSRRLQRVVERLRALAAS